MAALDATLTENVCLKYSGLKNILYFDGDGDYVDCGDAENLNIQVNITVAIWVSLSAVPDGSVMIAKSDQNSWNTINWELIALSVSEIQFKSKIGETEHGINIDIGTWELNRWYYVAFTYNGSQLNIYLNGTNIHSVGASGNMAQTTSTLKIGFTPPLGSFLNGKVKNARIWNVALPAGDITILYNDGNVATGLVSHWDFHEGSGSTLGDIVGTNHGTITGAIWMSAGQYLQKGISRTLTDAVDFSDVFSRIWNLVARVFTEGIKGRDVCNRGITRLLTDALSFLDAKAIFWKIFHGWRKKKSIDNTVWNRK